MKNVLFLYILFMISSSCVIYKAYKFVGVSNGFKNETVFKFQSESKRIINQRIQKLYLIKPIIKPDTAVFKHDMIHNYQNLDTPESKKWNSDTVNFHFVLVKNESIQIFYWLRFIGLQNEWNNIPCEIVLMKYYSIDKKNKKQRGY